MKIKRLILLLFISVLFYPRMIVKASKKYKSMDM